MGNFNPPYHSIFKIFIYFLERGKEKERERERNINVERNINQLSLIHAPNRGKTHNLGMCPDWELNWWTFALWDNSQPTEPNQSRPLQRSFDIVPVNADSY